MKTIQLFIGANNETGLVETDKLITILNGELAGYTISSARGLWQGKEEPSVIVDYLAEDNATPVELINQLKAELKQDAIAYRELPSLNFV